MIGVYGANGFIGRHLVRRLIATRAPARAISRRFDESFLSEFSGQIELLQADMRHPVEIAPSLQGIHTVVQFISTSAPALANDHIVADIQDNVLPHIEFVQSCVRANVRRYIFLSSGGAVYGNNAIHPTPETNPTNPISSHGLTKLMVEKYIQMRGDTDNLEFVVLRLSNAYGPGQEFKKGQGLIPAIISRYKSHSPVDIYGDGQAMRDYIFVDDIIDAITAALNLKGEPHLVLNIGSGESRSVIDVIETIEQVTGRRFERRYNPARKTDVEVSALDISLAREMLGWSPRTSFRDGITKTVASARHAEP